MFVGHGAVGDWRQPDVEFLASFRLPTARCDTLKDRHPFPREGRIVFDEVSHTYTVDGRYVVPRSVTGLVHKYTSDFNAPLIIAQMMARDSWAVKQREYLRADGQVMTAEEIRETWEWNGQVQRSRGTLLHFQIEAFLNLAIIEAGRSKINSRRTVPK